MVWVKCEGLYYLQNGDWIMSVKMTGGQKWIFKFVKQCISLQILLIAKHVHVYIFNLL